MNIGFYGKGGSGKTTLSALFAIWLDEKGYQVGLLDADVNSHTAEVIGATVKKDKILSHDQNERAIWKYLAGSNKRIKETEFLNTSPPGEGSGRWTLDKENFITKHYGQAFGKQSNVFTAGSYSAESVGIACHHGTQTVAENMISHAQFTSKQILVVDSVAGNDGFGTTLYLNDLLVFVIKPEREGIAVLNRFLELAKHADILERVVVIGNQVATDAQRLFLQKEIPVERLVGILDTNNELIEQRLGDRPLSAAIVRNQDGTIFEKILNRVKPQIDYYDSIVTLHKKVAAESWVAGSYRIGLEDQIDPEYQSV